MLGVGSYGVYVLGSGFTPACHRQASRWWRVRQAEQVAVLVLIDKEARPAIVLWLYPQCRPIPYADRVKVITRRVTCSS